MTGIWQEGEREAALAEIERREQQIRQERRDEVLAAIQARAMDEAKPKAKPTPVEQPVPATKLARAVSAAPDWLIGAIADAVFNEERARTEADDVLRHEVVKLQAQVGDLRRELAELRADLANARISRLEIDGNGTIISGRPTTNGSVHHHDG